MRRINSKWEVRTNRGGSLDEVVIGDPCWLHIEQLNDREFYLGIYGVDREDYHQFYIHVKRNGRTEVILGETGPAGNKVCQCG